MHRPCATLYASHGDVSRGNRREMEREGERERGRGEGGEREREENFYRSYATDPHAIIGFLRRIDIALCLLISILTSL